MSKRAHRRAKVKLNLRRQEFDGQQLGSKSGFRRPGSLNPKR